MVGETRGFFPSLREDLAELGFGGERGRLCLIATLSVVISTVIALELQLDNAWWAGISGFMVSQATSAASFRKGIQRIAGTAIGAAIAFFVMRWIAYDHLFCYAFLLVFTTVGVLGFELEDNGYAWLLAAVTADMIVLMSLQQPLLTLHVAVYRFAEISIGTIVAMLVAYALADDAPPAPAAPPAGFRSLFEAGAPALLHAVRTGISVMLIPLIWSWLDLPAVGAQMGVTAIVVGAVPVLGTKPSGLLSVVVTRALHRLIGCALSGAAALLCLMIPLTSFLPWILTLAAGAWIATHIQASPRGIGYAGTQMSLAFIMTLVQGSGPPASIWPGLDRFAGILLGLTILLFVSLILWPGEPEADLSAATPEEP